MLLRRKLNIFIMIQDIECVNPIIRCLVKNIWLQGTVISRMFLGSIYVLLGSNFQIWKIISAFCGKTRILYIIDKICYKYIEYLNYQFANMTKKQIYVLELYGFWYYKSFYHILNFNRYTLKTNLGYQNPYFMSFFSNCITWILQ